MSTGSESARLVEPSEDVTDPTRKSSSQLIRLARLVAPPLLIFILLTGLWEAASRTGVINEFIAPAPSAIASTFTELVTEGYFWSATRVTLYETLAGFVIGASTGFLVGVLTALFPWFRRSFYPYAITFQIMPKVVFAPLFLTWFGFGITSKIVMAAAISFFPLVVNTVAGVQSVDRDAQLMMGSLGVSRWQMFRYLTLPSAAPFIFAGIKNALTLALIGAIVAEFVGASEGLGVLLKQFQFQLDVTRVYVIIVFLGVMGLGLYGLIVWAEKKIIFWRTNIWGVP